MEILASLTLTEEEFLKEKSELMEQILTTIREKARNEGELLLRTNSKTGEFLTDHFRSDFEKNQCLHLPIA